jgi:hypothetical protein
MTEPTQEEVPAASPEQDCGCGKKGGPAASEGGLPDPGALDDRLDALAGEGTLDAEVLEEHLDALDEGDAPALTLDQIVSYLQANPGLKLTLSF